MFSYEKMLQYPVNIKNPNPKYAQIVLEQYGGPDGELGASLRYLSQRFSMPYPELKGLLTDIGTEELGHLEMIGAIVYQLTRNLTQEQIKQGGFDAYFVNHTTGVYPAGANGVPFNAGAIASKGDVITNLHENKPVQHHGKQTLKQLMKQNAGVSSIEITDSNIKAFESTAKKYGVDFALKKDATESPPRYLVFFKGRDADVLTAAFQEFSTKKLTQEQKPSIRKALAAFKDKAKQLNADRQKVKNQTRGGIER